jgi:8-oxo-dGTP pyrophosphatase MutT (NUDIX family)
VIGAEQLRDLLLTPEQAARTRAVGSVDAAVLVPLFTDSEGGLHTVLTKRRDDLRRHAGEISFPGGRQDTPEESLEDTALREANEEIGLDPAAVELVGALPPTPTFVTGYRIHSFVGLIEPGHAWTPQPTEVDAVLELSLGALLEGFELQRLVRRGVPFKTPTYTVGNNFVWGATARILGHLLERLKPIL